MRLPSPNVFNIILIFTIILQLILPVPDFIIPFQKIISILLIVIGLSLNLWAIQYLRRNKTTTGYGKEPKTLVIGGPFKLSRNPLYLGGVAFSLGTGVWFGSYLILIFVALMFTALNLYYIPVEETSLVKTFGEEYAHYKRKVRRWL